MIDPDDDNASPEPEDDDDYPLDPGWEEDMRAAFEAEATAAFGPPEERERKNRAYVAELCEAYTEPVIRGLLRTLSVADDPLWASELAEVDLAEVIQPFEPFGTDFEIEEVQGDDYTVRVKRAFGTAGRGGGFLIGRVGDVFQIKRQLWWSIA